MAIDQVNIFFKFKLKHLGRQYSPLEPTVILKREFLRRNDGGKILGEVKKDIKLNLKSKSLFEG